MLDLDQVESQFRATLKVKPVFILPEVKRIAVVTDAPADGAEAVIAKYKTLLAPMAQKDEFEWMLCAGDEAKRVSAMVNMVNEVKPELIVVARHLFEEDVDLAHSLGTHVDTLTQAVDTPVLLTPHPRSPSFEKATQSIGRILVVTDHIVGDSRLVSWGLRLAQHGGMLKLAHVEDDAVFVRYLEAISRIPDIDTAIAESQLKARLLDDARTYLVEVQEQLSVSHPKVEVTHDVILGHTIQDYVRLIREEQLDIVVMNTKDDTQQAMHGAAYSLSVELVQMPLLLL